MYMYIYNIYYAMGIRYVHGLLKDHLYYAPCLTCRVCRACLALAGHIIFMITHTLCPSYFCEIWALCVLWIT